MRIETKNGLAQLLKRYRRAGVTDDTLDESGSYKARWLSVIEGCIKEGLPMDEIDYDNTPKWLRPLWKGLK